MKYTFSDVYKPLERSIIKIITDFDSTGKKFDDRNRNSIKLFDLEGIVVNVKSFKVPNLVNRVAYKILRSSKAERSFRYAHILLEKNINTPQPIAYFEQDGFLFGRSFYVSEHLEYDLTYRELCTKSPYEGNTDILAAFARFTYDLHKKEIHFLDHSLGNTLIKIDDDTISFYLVDLNRMEFGPMNFKTRMKNFERLSSRTKDIRVMANAYAEESGEDPEFIFREISKATKSYQESFYKKKKLKKSLKFWK